MRKINVLFVCLGNICRSPTAEGVFRHLANERGVGDQFEIDSAGTSGWHKDAPPDSRSQQEARRHGIDLSDQRSRAVVDEDFARFDYIIAMDSTNLSDLEQRCPDAYRERLHRFTAFAPALGVADVPDPYYGGEDGFAQVYEIIRASAEGLLDTIVAERVAG